jgi:hypothetical protein
MNLLLMRARCFPVQGRPMQRNAMFPVSTKEDCCERLEAVGRNERDEPKRNVRSQLGFSRLKTWAFSSKAKSSP